MRAFLTAAAYALTCTYPVCVIVAALRDADVVRTMQAGYAVSCLGWLLFIGLIVWSRRRVQNDGRLPALRFLLIAAVAMRVVLLPISPSDDVHRYVWEGRVRLAGFNPYLVAPDDERLAHLRDANWDEINHREHRAIYGPLTELLCTAVAGVWPSVYAFKIVMLGADLLTLAVLAAWLRQRREDPRWLVVYAFCPAVLSAFAREAHIDAIMVLALAYFLKVCDRPPDRDRPKRTSARDAMLSGAAFGVAVGAKWVPLLLLPWWGVKLLGGLPRRLRDLRPALLGAVVAALAFVLPVSFYADAGLEIVGSLRYFAKTFHVLDYARQTLAQYMAPGSVEWTALCIIVVVAVGLAAARIRSAPAALWTIGTALLLSPTIHPWYVTWLLPALCLHRSWPWFVLPVTLVFAFEGDHLREVTGQWYMPPWVAPWVFGPFFAALLIWAAARAVIRLKGNRRSPNRPTTTPPASG